MVSESSDIVAGTRILSNVIRTQVEIHDPYGGVVPEIASREHVRSLGPVIEADCTIGTCSRPPEKRFSGLREPTRQGRNHASQLQTSRRLTVPFINSQGEPIPPRAIVQFDNVTLMVDEG